MSRRKRVLLTGIGGNTAQSIARSLLKFPEEFVLVGADSDRYNVRFGLNYAERVYLVPSAEADDYLGCISKIVQKERIDLTIPSPDPEVYMISKGREELDTVVLLPDHSVIEVAQDKWLTYETLDGEVPQPPSKLISEYRDLETALSRLNKPIWLRKRKGAGGLRSFIANNVTEAKFWVEYWRGYGEFMASQILRGRNLSWIGLYHEGELVSSGGYLRLRYFSQHVSPTGVTGNVSAGTTVHDDELNAVAERAIETLDTRPNGIYTVDLKEHGEPKVTEVNAGRFHASSYVYAEAGLNLAYHYSKLALGEPVEVSLKRNALKSGIVTIRSMDNQPIIVENGELARDILTP